MNALITLHTYPLPAGVIGSAEWCDHHSGPSIEPCHRYALYRQLDDMIHRASRDSGGHVCRALACIGTNPSAAAADRDDSTVRLLWLLAVREGFCKLVMLNGYGWRVTDPKGLRDVVDPIGTRNDARILFETAFATKILACWGSIPPARDAQLRKLLSYVRDKTYCLGLTKAGQPRHPLRTPIKGVEWTPLPFAEPIRD